MEAAIKLNISNHNLQKLCIILKAARYLVAIVQFCIIEIFFVFDSQTNIIVVIDVKCDCIHVFVKTGLIFTTTNI